MKQKKLFRFFDEILSDIQRIYIDSSSMCVFMWVCVWVVTKSIWGRISVSPKVNIARTLKWLPFIIICFFFFPNIYLFCSLALTHSHCHMPIRFYPMLFLVSFYVTINFIGHRNECSFHSIYFLNGDSTHFTFVFAFPVVPHFLFFLFCHFSDLDYINFDEHVYILSTVFTLSVIFLFLFALFVDVVIVVTLTFHFGTTDENKI